MTRDWVGYAKALLRTEMAKRRLSYDDLARRLADIGVKESAPNLRNKLSRGSFTAVFFIQCLIAMGVTDLRLDQKP